MKGLPGGEAPSDSETGLIWMVRFGLSTLRGVDVLG